MNRCAKTGGRSNVGARVLVAFAFGIVLMGCRTPDIKVATDSRVAVSEDAEDTSEFLLRRGDWLEIEFTLPPDKEKRLRFERVSRDGTVAFLHIGKVMAAGRTSAEFASVIEEKYRPQYFPGVEVAIHRGQPNSFHFYQDKEISMRIEESAFSQTNGASVRRLNVLGNDSAIKIREIFEILDIDSHRVAMTVEKFGVIDVYHWRLSPRFELSVSAVQMDSDTEFVDALNLEGFDVKIVHLDR